MTGWQAAGRGMEQTQQSSPAAKILRCSMLAAAVVAALGALLPAAPAKAEGGILLDLDGPAERSVVRYACEGAEPFDVEYVNLPAGSLAIVPVEGERRLFVDVVSGSGAKYASGRYVWWTKGSSAQLFDELAGGAPRSCEAVEAAR